jgi:hypothetical protein
VLNVRSGPGTQYKIVKMLTPGQCGVLLTGRRNGMWVEIRTGQFGDWRGWVNRKFLRYYNQREATQTCLQEGEWCGEGTCCQGLQCVMGRHEGKPWEYCEDQATASSRPYWCTRSDQNAAESAICDTQSLHVHDSAIRTAYSRATSDSPADADYIRKQQKAWLKKRDACGYDISCIRIRYDDQISWLEGYFSN